MSDAAAAPDLVLCAVHEERLERIEQQLDDQEQRLRKLESIPAKLDNLSEKFTRTSRSQMLLLAAVVVGAQVLDERILPVLLKLLAP